MGFFWIFSLDYNQFMLGIGYLQISAIGIVC